MVNYQNTKIYRIYPSCDHEEGDVYIGSTTKLYLSYRMAIHRCSSNTTSSKLLFEKYGVENCKIELLELFPCNSRDEQSAKEGEWIRKTNCVNKQIAGRTKKEYQKEYRDEHKEQIKEYYLEHKEQKKEYNKEYNLEHKEQIKENQKEYKLQNKEQIKEYKKEYRLDNKEQIKEQMSKKFVCECGSCYRYGDKARHFKSIKHSNYFDKAANNFETFSLSFVK
jgi:hypothetical protein